jgi:1-acyl-sn-glycerol-3-phosphate acyltransferase
LIHRYFSEPYRFIPPYRRDLWCRFARRFLPNHVARTTRIVRYEFKGAELLRQSIDDGAGIVLAANHSRWADGVVLARLGIELDQFFYYMVSYHIFKQSKLTGWWINRLGCYSIWREGTDREAMRATSHVLATAERPIVIFPEGTWYRQNDRIGPLQDGLSLMFRMAAKQSERPLRVHPVAVKYWNLDDPRPVLAERLTRLEEDMGWKAQHDLELVPRIEKLGSALLALKEVEHLGDAQSGPLDERLSRLTTTLVAGLEKFHLGREFDNHIMERIRRLRQRLARRLVEDGGDAAVVQRSRRDLDTLLLCENLNAHSLEYLRELPGPERLSETVQRIEETIYDADEEPVGDLGAVIEVCPAIDVRSLPEAGRTGPDPLIRDLSDALKGRLNRLVAEGPPPAWSCPPSLAPRPAFAGSGTGS